jgi:CHAD domain
MSFLVAQWETSGAGLARVMREQADKLVLECETAGEDPAGFAHKARVRAKKIRAALRLAEPLLGAKAYRRENHWWRNAARELSGLRDANARLEALEALTPFLTARIGSAMMRRLKERFEKLREAHPGDAIVAFCQQVAERARDLTPDLPPSGREEMAKAMVATYREGRSAMKKALKRNDPLLLHEWRKQTKYHALQARLMRLTFPETLEDRTSAARKLAELLGDIQDIHVVLESARDWAEAPEGFSVALKERRKELIADAQHAGRKLFSEKPKAFRARLLNPPSERSLPMTPEEVVS